MITRPLIPFRNGPKMALPTAFGVWLVFRRQMLNRNAWRDLGFMALLLGILFLVAAEIRGLIYQNAVYFEVQLDWASGRVTVVLSAALLLLPCAAVLGAGAVPTSVEFESTQSSLLTRLTAFDLVAGRLLAALWPTLTTVLASCAFWLAAQLVRPSVHGGSEAFGPILIAHFVLLCGVLMMGAIGFLFAERRRPGRLWGRGVGVALVWWFLCVTGVMLLNPVILRLRNPVPLIETALLVNPATATMSAFGHDLLRAPWIYDHSSAQDYPFTYPAPLATAGVFLWVALGATMLAAVRLRRAYR